MKIVKKNINELIKAEYNPRRMSIATRKALKRSIEKFGYVEPIVWNVRTGRVVGGNQRLNALKELGFETVDVVEVDLNEEEEKQLNLALNKISGEWDEALLRTVIESILNTDIEVTGFTQEEIDELFEMPEVEFADALEEPEPKKKDKERKAYTCPKCGFTFYVE